VLELL